MRPRSLPAAVLLLATAWPAAAHAGDAEVTSDTAAQFYDVRSPTGETVLTRRRVTTTLAVGGYDLLEHAERGPRDAHAPELLFRARLRYDADYGASPAEVDPTNAGRFVPGFDRGPVDLMYGYVEGRRFLHGWLGFKAGRQYVVDGLGWYSFDGGEVKVTTPYFFAVEGYGGLEVRGGMPLSTPRFERDGVWRGDRSGVDPSIYPSFQPSDVAPVIGASLESSGVTWLHGRLTYRRVLNTGDSTTTEFASGLYNPATYSGTRISSERIGYTLDASLWDFANARGGLVYDLYVAKLSNVYASVDGFLAKNWSVGVDYELYVPTYDADSIWNFFMSEPLNDLGVRSTWEATEHLALSADARARIYTVQTSEDQPNASPNIQPTNAPYFPASSTAYDGGGDLSARYKFGEGALAARASGNWGDGGDRVGGMLSGERTFEARYLLEGRASLWQWKDNLRPDRDATSFGYVAGVGYRFSPRSRTLFEFQHDMNRLVGQRFRAMIWLTVAVTK
jgi:hypothetical protein